MFTKVDSQFAVSSAYAAEKVIISHAGNLHGLNLIRGQSVCTGEIREDIHLIRGGAFRKSVNVL